MDVQEYLSRDFVLGELLARNARKYPRGDEAFPTASTTFG